MTTEWQRRCDTGHCIETRDDGDQVIIRESSNPDAELRVPRESWEAYLGAVREKAIHPTDG